MVVVLVMAILGVTGILAQMVHHVPSFTYLGCSKVDLTCFGKPMTFSNGLTPETCQRACQGHLLAAIFPDSCRCGDDANSITIIDESVCDHPCMGNAALGACGGARPDEGPGIGNVYGRTGSATQVPRPVTTNTVKSLSLSFPSAAYSTCSERPASLATSQAASPASPLGPAPGVPTAFPAHSALPSAPALPSFPPASKSSECPETPCSEAEASTTRPSKSLTPSPKSPGQPAEPPSYGAPTLPTPETVVTDKPKTKTRVHPHPSTHPRHAASSSAPSCSPDTPSQSANDDTSAGGNCTSIESDSIPPETTLWPKAPDGLEPQVQPPAPSQVPGSESTHSHVPLFTTIGGLALVAAVMM
ncbi:hypothetical protein DCS_03488 [Drechmeria coniospora]|uniref:WSC domain-containing protein n=1 Tax=Drechmeria coniospora TaxID=98403 RepID=A0A151GHD6_DRECN|nr:hypothetical protein DCS_03488 [Drechmeria coniospora]KYK56488.1 hypothetical protein DCS_03488 [Drechmeria coniospora]